MPVFNLPGVPDMLAPALLPGRWKPVITLVRNRAVTNFRQLAYPRNMYFLYSILQVSLISARDIVISILVVVKLNTVLVLVRN